MPKYVYTGKTTQGHKIKGYIISDSISSAERTLKNYGYIDLKISPATIIDDINAFLTAVPQEKLVIFTREFAEMYDAGLPLIKILDILAAQLENERLKYAVLIIGEEVKAGRNFVNTLMRFPDIFNEAYIGMIRAGEKTGDLGGALRNVADYLEKDLMLKKKVYSALTYPVIVLVVSLLIVLGLVNYIFPKFVYMLKTLNVELPIYTKILISVVEFLKGYWWIIIAIIIFALLFFKEVFLKTHTGRLWFHKFLLTIPIFGDTFKKITLARFARTFASLFASGVPLISVLDIISQSTGNEVVLSFLDDMKEGVKSGEKIVEVFSETGFFPPIFLGMLEVGEQTGSLAVVLNKLADSYEFEVDQVLNALSSIIEPILLIVMGVIVGVVLLSVFTPLYSIMQGFAK